MQLNSQLAQMPSQHEAALREAVQSSASAKQQWRVLIAHPGRQHSHQAALALHEAGYLACYATGIPVSKFQFGRFGQRLLSKYSAYDGVDVPAKLTRLNMVSPILNRVVARHLPEYLVGPILYETYRMFDRWVARLIERQHFDAVILYENSALQSFKAAKKVGAKCILDAASLHRIEADRRYEVALPRGYKGSVDVRKDMEIALADCIFATSDLAAESYRAHVKRVPVKSITLGVDIDRFKPTARHVGSVSEGAIFTFVFVGTATRRKGFDLLVEAVERLLQEGLSFRVLVAGNIDKALLAGRVRALQAIVEYGRIGHDELVSVLGNADCLLLPSRVDSFGMVVPEAMACGLPVIVSDMVGAKQLVEEGRNGFVVPAGNVNALLERMRWSINNRGSLERMSTAARAVAEQTSWAKYRARFAAAVREVLLER
jgi:glycosyltransferase involved in cell wall biosynthesis